MPFQIGLSNPSAQVTRERLRRAKALRPSAFQVTLPDWYPPGMPEVLAFLQTMTADKAAAVAGGWLPGLTPRVRWPYRSVAATEAARIGTFARAQLPELFDA